MLRKNDIDRGRNAFFMATIAALLAIYPAIISWLSQGVSGIFQFFAADTFYYLAIAKNSSWVPLFSFDGSNPTNGFHPLYQLILKLSFLNPLLANNQYSQIIYVYCLSVAMVGISAAIVTYRLIKLKMPAGLTLIAIVPGIIYFGISIVAPNYGSLWAYINGMESPLSLLLFTCLFSIILNDNKLINSGIIKLITISLIISLIILTRLDDIFILPAICIPYILYSKSLRDGVKSSLYLVGLPTILVFTYCAVNYSYAGSFMPISGQSKGGFSLIANLLNFGNIYFPLKEFIKINPWEYWDEVSWRALLNLIPIIIGVIYLTLFKIKLYPKLNKNNLCCLDILLMTLSIYILLKGGYSLIFVNLWHQGHWYYPVSILVSNIILIRLIHEYIILPNINIYFDLKNNKNKFIFKLTITITISFLILLYLYVPNLSLNYKNGIKNEYVNPLIGICIIILIGTLIGKIKRIFFPTSVLLIISIILMTANGFISQKSRYNYNELYESFWKRRIEITKDLLIIDPSIKLLSYDDGIDAYSLNIPVMNGLGFALDIEASKSKKLNKLLDLAKERGFNYISSLTYMPNFKAEIGDDVSSYLLNSLMMSDNNNSNWSYYLVYEDKITGFKVLSFKKINIENNAINK
jgi:hypothetical protein